MTMDTLHNVMELATSLEQRRAAAMVSGDIDDFAVMLSPDLTYVHSSGLYDSRESLLQKLRDGTILYRRAEATVESAIALGADAFMARGTLELDARVGAAERQMRSIYLVIWLREGDAWRLVGHQTTSRPPQEKTIAT
jgi:hypothetical protein